MSVNILSSGIITLDSFALRRSSNAASILRLSIFLVDAKILELTYTDNASESVEHKPRPSRH